MFGKLLGLTEARVVQDPKWSKWGSGDDFVGVGNTSAGQSVTQDSSLQLLAVYGSVSFIADTISTLPLQVFRDSAAGKVEITTPRWLMAPNAETDRVAFIVQAVMSLLLDGNIYLVPTRNATGQVVELWILHPSWVSVTRPRAGGPKEYTVGGVPFYGEIVHIPWMVQPGGLKGLSPIECARQSIGLGMGALEQGATLFREGVTLSGVIESAGDLDDDEARVMANSFKRAHAGSSKAHLPGVLTGGATWKNVQMTQEQAQFLETRKYTTAEIAAQVYHLDPSWLGVGIDGSSLEYKTLESRGIHLVQFTLLPVLVRLERAFSSLLPQPQFSKFNPDALMRADLKSRYEAHQIALGGNGGVPFKVVAEVRDIEDLPPMPETAPPEPDPAEVST